MVFDRTAEVDVDVDTENSTMSLNVTGAALLEDVGDFVLSIEVPDEVASLYEIHEEPPRGWPFREYWFPVDIAHEYRGTLRVQDNDGGDVRPDLVGK